MKWMLPWSDHVLQTSWTGNSTISTMVLSTGDSPVSVAMFDDGNINIIDVQTLRWLDHKSSDPSKRFNVIVLKVCHHENGKPQKGQVQSSSFLYCTWASLALCPPPWENAQGLSSDTGYLSLYNILSRTKINKSVILNRLTLFLFMCRCACFCWIVHMSAGNCGEQKRTSDPLKLELQVVVN